MINLWLSALVAFLILFNHLLTLFFNWILIEHLLCARDCGGISCPCLYTWSAHSATKMTEAQDFRSSRIFIYSFKQSLQTCISDGMENSSMTVSWLICSSIQPHVLPDPCPVYSNCCRPHTARANDATLPVAVYVFPCSLLCLACHNHLPSPGQLPLSPQESVLTPMTSSMRATEQCISRQCCSSASSLDLWPRGQRPCLICGTLGARVTTQKCETQLWVFKGNPIHSLVVPRCEVYFSA